METKKLMTFGKGLVEPIRFRQDVLFNGTLVGQLYTSYSATTSLEGEKFISIDLTEKEVNRIVSSLSMDTDMLRIHDWAFCNIEYRPSNDHQGRENLCELTQKIYEIKYK